MKNKRLLFLFITLLTLAQGAWADDPEWLKSGDSWDEATKTLTVNSNPVNNAYQNNTDIEHVIVSDNVENIGSRAFDSCTKLKTIVIGNGVKNINRDAFENCTSLKTIIMTRTSSAPSINGTPFYPNFDLKIYVPMDSNGNILEDYTKGDWRAYLLVNMLVGSWRSGTCAVTYKNNVLTVVGWGAMADDIPSYRGWNRHCSDVTSVVIEDGVTHIGGDAFLGCRNLASVTIPASVTSIGSGAFSDCSSLPSINISANVQSIGSGAFSGCNSLATITVDEDNQTFDSRGDCNAIIRKEGNELVAGCKNTTIPEDVQSIGERAFYGCGSLTSITIPASVTSIGGQAFYICGLTAITIPNSVQSIGDNAFFWCSNLESVSIGSGVESISPNTFNRCHNLRTITIDANNPTFDSRDGCNAIIRKSDDELVVGCYATIIPNSVKSIGDMAFMQTALQAITIPASVQSIGSTAFLSCSNLKTVTIYATSVPTLGASAFGYNYNDRNPKIYVFSDCVEAYKAAWGIYANDIEAIGGTCGKTNSDNVTWELAGELGNCALIISGTGAMADYSAGYQPWAAYNAGITKVIIGSGVTEVSSSAFIGCENLTTVTIADGLYLHNGTEVLSGDITDMSKLNGKTLTPAIVLADKSDNTSAIATAATACIGDKTLAVQLSDRTLYKDGDWNTLCLPFSLADLTGTPLEGATVKELNVDGTYDTDKKTGFDDGTLYLYFKDATAIEAGKPYLVKWDKAADYDDDPSKYDITAPVFTGVTISSTTPGSVTSDDNLVQFKGIYNPTEIYSAANDNLFLGAGNNLYWPSTEGYTLNACRAYFHVALSGEQQVREIRMNLDSTTGVETVQGFLDEPSGKAERKSSRVQEAGAWFDLFGRKLNGKPTQKGMYIHDGKAVVVSD